MQSMSAVGLPTPPTGTEVASYRSYAEAQAAVDHLSDRELDVRVLTIVGTDLRLVERITGRLTVGKVVLSGALSGMWFGLFISILMTLWSSEPSYMILPMGIAMGALFGIIFNVVPYLMRRGERDFTSATQVVASRYAVLARENVNEYRQILANSPGNLTRPVQTRVQSDPNVPTAFGSRPDEEPKYGVRLSDEERQQRNEAPVAPAQDDPQPTTPDQGNGVAPESSDSSENNKPGD
ncbi:MAG: hypothetical protein Q4P71_01245 [Actinomycetaceae bacterium]|nr:hypothetical protein [Actinomycetaceae bacterium]